MVTNNRTTMQQGKRVRKSLAAMYGAAHGKTTVKKIVKSPVANLKARLRSGS